MKAQLTAASAAAILAATSYASPMSFNYPRSTISGTDLPGVPDGCMTSYSNILFGWLPDEENGMKMADINSASGKKGCFQGDYSQIQDASSYDGSQLTSRMDDIKGQGAVFVPAVMPNGVAWSDVTEDVANKIGDVIKQFTTQGVTVYLRFAHEMNCYAKAGCAQDGDPVYKGGDPSEFAGAWHNVASVCRGIDGCYTYWCPNSAGNDDIQQYWPDPADVDIVGIDWYVGDDDISKGFSGVFGDFYNQFAKGYNKPFIIGETGTHSADTTQKENWLKTITQGDFSDFPLYKGAMWFEYNKGYDFKILVGEDSSTIDQTLSNFQ